MEARVCKVKRAVDNRLHVTNQSRPYLDFYWSFSSQSWKWSSSDNDGAWYLEIALGDLPIPWGYI